MDARYRQVLLHRGQSAHSGRAHGDRSRHRHRHRQGADPGRRRRPCRHRPADGHAAADEESSSTATRMQCRITTEDPENNFIPDYGRITAYRGATGFGIRLDGGTAYSGAVITRFYDPLLEKVTAWAPTPEEAIAPHGPRAARVPHSRRLHQPRLPRERHHSPEISARTAIRPGSSTRRPNCSSLQPRQRSRDEAPDLHRGRHRQRPSGYARPCRSRRPKRRLRWRRSVRQPRRRRSARSCSTRLARKAFADVDAGAEARARHRHDDARRVISPARDAHALVRHDRRRRRPMPRCCRSSSSLECWGGATFDVADALPRRIPWERLARSARERAQHLLTQMLLRGVNGVGYTNYPDNVVQSFVAQAAKAGSISSVSSTGSTGSRTCASRWMRSWRRRQALRGGDLLHRRHSRSGAGEIRPEILRRAGQGTEGRRRAHARP